MGLSSKGGSKEGKMKWSNKSFWIICVLQTFSCINSHLFRQFNFYNWIKDFFSFIKYFLISNYFHLSKIFICSYWCLLLLEIKPGALKAALGIESPLHSLPELRMMPDLSKNLSLKLKFPIPTSTLNVKLQPQLQTLT